MSSPANLRPAQRYLAQKIGDLHGLWVSVDLPATKKALAIACRTAVLESAGAATGGSGAHNWRSGAWSPSKRPTKVSPSAMIQRRP